MSKARERQKQRRQNHEMVRKAGQSISQAAPKSQRKLPKFNIPGGQWLLIIPAAGFVLIAVILALRFINPPDTSTPPNGIWLNKSWTYIEHNSEELEEITTSFIRNDIGAIFLYTSSLRADGTWSGLADENNRFTDVEPQIESLVDDIRSAYPSVKLYAWVEVNVQSPEYRLDQAQIQNTIANFSARMVNQLEFDGVLLDIKPIFEESEDYIQLLRTVKREIGIDTELLVAVPPDLTPSGTELTLPNVIAPGTEWSNEYKQRVALLANQIVISAYNSYQTNPVDYIEWVSYQVDSYVTALSEIDSNTTILVSVPNYEPATQAHDPEIESLAGALDGVVRSANLLDETNSQVLAGVAIFTDELLSDAEWSIYRQRWSR
ncbi:MAG: hypothetical protein Phog2KO_26170 [Phototrophicaceae bacterium]